MFLQNFVNFYRFFFISFMKAMSEIKYLLQNGNRIPTSLNNVLTQPNDNNSNSSFKNHEKVHLGSNKFSEYLQK